MSPECNLVNRLRAMAELVAVILWGLSLFAGAPVLAAAPVGPAAAAAVVDVLHLDGVVAPATSHYVTRGLRQAERDGAAALLIEIDTPGGLLKSMEDIAKAMLNTGMPTVVYVYPSGSRAASAGVFITYAATIAAMAPTTHLGAAHPVGVGGVGGGGSPMLPHLLAMALPAPKV